MRYDRWATEPEVWDTDYEPVPSEQGVGSFNYEPTDLTGQPRVADFDYTPLGWTLNN